MKIQIPNWSKILEYIQLVMRLFKGYLQTTKKKKNVMTQTGIYQKKYI
jgi:hypothetical protein